MILYTQFDWMKVQFGRKSTVVLMKRIGIFSKLLWQSRVTAGFRTARSFIFVLADFGVANEESTYTRWENGNRLPKNRSDIIAIIGCLLKYNGITSIEEANSLLESSGRGYLTKIETQLLWKYIAYHTPHNLETMKALLG